MLKNVCLCLFFPWENISQGYFSQGGREYCGGPFMTLLSIVKNNNNLKFLANNKKYYLKYFSYKISILIKSLKNRIYQKKILKNINNHTSII